MSFGSDMESPIKRQNSYVTPDFAGILVINVPLDTRLPAWIRIPPFYNRLVTRSICLAITLVELKGWSLEYALSMKLAERRALVEVELWDESEMAKLFSPKPDTFLRRNSCSSLLTTATEELEPQEEDETNTVLPNVSRKRGNDDLELDSVESSPSNIRHRLRPRKQPRLDNLSNVPLPSDDYFEERTGGNLFADYVPASTKRVKKFFYDEESGGFHDVNPDGSLEEVN